MFLLFISNIFSAQYVAIDVGTEYIKFAESTFSGEPRMLKDGVYPEILPTAAAFRSKKPLNYPLKEEDIRNSELRIGKSALSILKKNESLGLNYITYSLGRLNSKYSPNTTLIAEKEELFGAYLYSRFQGYPITSGFVLVVPSYWTSQQRNSIARSLSLYNLPFLGSIDEDSAYAVLYADTRATRFAEEPRNVLFIDVGATSVKCYSHHYYWNSTHYFTEISGTAISWTEKAGGLIFAQAYAERKNISLKKARKQLSRLDVKTAAEILAPEVENLIKTIQDAIDTSIMTSKALGLSSNIHEVQLVGGASQIPFISEMIKILIKENEKEQEKDNETVPIEIKRDFNANEALAIGGIYSCMENEGTSSYPSIRYLPIPPHSIYLTCGMRQKYCQKGNLCRETLIEQDFQGCDEIIFDTDLSQIPEGADPILNRYRLLNISNSNINSSAHQTVYFTLSPPAPALKEVSWCVEGNNCTTIDFEEIHEKNFEEPTPFSTLFQKVSNEKFKKNKLIAKIADLIDKVSPLIGAVEDPGRTVDANDEKHKQMQEKMIKYKEMMDEGSFISLNDHNLQNIYDDITIIYKSITKKKQEL